MIIRYWFFLSYLITTVQKEIFYFVTKNIFDDLKFFCQIEGIEEKILDKCNSLEKLFLKQNWKEEEKLGTCFCALFSEWYSLFELKV